MEKPNFNTSGRGPAFGRPPPPSPPRRPRGRGWTAGAVWPVGCELRPGPGPAETLSPEGRLVPRPASRVHTFLGPAPPGPSARARPPVAPKAALPSTRPCPQPALPASSGVRARPPPRSANDRNNLPVWPPSLPPDPEHGEDRRRVPTLASPTWMLAGRGDVKSTLPIAGGRGGRAERRDPPPPPGSCCFNYRPSRTHRTAGPGRGERRVLGLQREWPLAAPLPSFFFFFFFFLGINVFPITRPRRARQPGARSNGRRHVGSARRVEQSSFEAVSHARAPRPPPGPHPAPPARRRRAGCTARRAAPRARSPDLPGARAGFRRRRRA